MALNRITGSNPALVPGSRDRASISESARKAIRAPAQGAEDVNAAHRSTDEVPTQAPPGTDPALWSVLTHEERSFFATVQSPEPPTYGPTRRGRIAPGALLGSRIDLRV